MRHFTFLLNKFAETFTKQYNQRRLNEFKKLAGAFLHQRDCPLCTERPTEPYVCTCGKICS